MSTTPMTTPNDAPRPTNELDEAEKKRAEIERQVHEGELGTRDKMLPKFFWLLYETELQIERRREAAASLQSLEARNLLLEQASSNAHKVFAAEIEQLHRAIKSLEARNKELEGALIAVVADVLEYERVNKLSPNPGREYCWDSVAKARAALHPATKTGET